MTPSAINGLIALCAVLGLSGGFLAYGARIVLIFGKLTTSIETLTGSVVRMEGLTANISQKIDTHAERIDQHENRLYKLELLVGTNDQADGLIIDLMKVNERRRRRGEL